MQYLQFCQYPNSSSNNETDVLWEYFAKTGVVLTYETMRVTYSDVKIFH